jgi:AcrR family transcriptional regulator
MSNTEQKRQFDREMGRQMAKVPIDRRVVRSRDSLHQALLSLIMTKGYDAITVEEICERANVGRSTFYAHFTSKDDLKRRGLEHLRRELIERQKSASRLTVNNVSGLAFTLTMFEHARDHIHLYRALVGSRGGAIALTTIRQTLCEIVRGELAEIRDKDSHGTPREFAVQYIVGAFMAALTWWLDGGAKLPPQRINAMFQRLATDGIASLGR